MTEKYPERLTEIEDTRTHDDEAAQKGLKSVDTVHNDEALKVLANYHGEEGWTPQEEKKIRRKVDRRLMPILCISYGLQYYDKGTQHFSVLSLVADSFIQQCLVKQHFSGCVQTSTLALAIDIA